MAADDVPVVFHGKPTSQAFFESAEAGFCLDLSDQPFIQNAIPSILESVKSEDGKVYAMPYSQNFMGVFYNVDIFKEHNLDIPKTWDEFMALCQKLEDAGIQPLEESYKDSAMAGHYRGALWQRCSRMALCGLLNVHQIRIRNLLIILTIGLLQRKQFRLWIIVTKMYLEFRRRRQWKTLRMDSLQ